MSVTRPLVVGVTGLNATDNPAPGVGVLRSLRAAGRGYRLVGLAYDALDPGLYAADIADEVFLLPYPSQGLEALLARLAHVRERVGLDVIIPTLDAELSSFIDGEARLRAMGIRMFLPDREQLEVRSKARLMELGVLAGIAVPQSAVLSGVDDLHRVHQRVPFPLYVKGAYYGATLCRGLDEAVVAYHKALAQWGPPVVVQTHVDGEEFNVIAVGDGRGGLCGAVPMKKLVLTDKGKGWAGITVKDPDLLRLAAGFMKATSWRGPCELEVIRDAAGRYLLLEINPRFPAWVYLSAGAGVNLPHAVVRLASGQAAPSFPDYQVGAMFVRISLDQIVSLSDFQSIVTEGELSRGGTL